MSIEMKTRISKQWYEFAALALADIPAESVQRKEMRRAFYAGASACYTEIMAGLTPGPDSQPEDEHMIAEMDFELKAFADAVKRGLA